LIQRVNRCVHLVEDGDLEAANAVFDRATTQTLGLQQRDVEELITSAAELRGSVEV
jgi:hypothetical protein